MALVMTSLTITLVTGNWPNEEYDISISSIHKWLYKDTKYDKIVIWLNDDDGNNKNHNNDIKTPKFI